MKTPIKNLIIIIIIPLFISSCNDSSGYSDLENLYKESLAVLRSKDKSLITEFMTDLLPDKNTASYMKKNKCVYRGYPEKLKEYPYAIDSAIVHLSDKFYKYAQSLDTKGSLEDLRFIGFDRDPDPEPLNEPRCKCEEVLFTEFFGVFVSDKNNDTIYYSFGELLKVNGKWKGFTDFKLW